MALDGRATDKRRIQDDDGDSLEIVDSGLHTTDHDYVETIEGENYYIEYHNDALADGSTATLGISTCTDHHMRMTYSVEVEEGTCEVQLREECTYTGGSAGTAVNLNRNFGAHCTGLTFTINPTVTDEGDVLETMHFFSASRFVPKGVSSRGISWILKPNTKYILKISNESGGAIIMLADLKFHLHSI